MSLSWSVCCLQRRKADTTHNQTTVKADQSNLNLIYNGNKKKNNLREKYEEWTLTDDVKEICSYFLAMVKD